MSERLRLGLIGAGSIGHAQLNHLRHFPDVEIVALADPDERARARAREQHGVAKGWDDWRAMVHGETLDAVTICTPNGLHAEQSIACLRAGLHVLVEKPMAMDTRQASAMADVARDCGRHLVVGFQFRFDPRTEALRRQIEAGVFGRVLHVRCQALRRRGIPNRGVFGRREMTGGGPMIDIGVHVLEMAHWLMGSPRPVTTSGQCWTYLGDKPMGALCKWPDWDWRTYTVEDLAIGFVRFHDGSSLSLETSFAAHIADDAWNLQLLGENAGATWDPPVVHRDGNGYMWNEAPAHLGERHVFGWKLRHFVDVCRGRTPNLAPPEHGIMVQAMIDGLYRSAQLGREIRLDGTDQG